MHSESVGSITPLSKFAIAVHRTPLNHLRLLLSQMQQDTAESVRVLLRYKKPYKGEHCQTVFIVQVSSIQEGGACLRLFIFSLCRASDTTKATLSKF